MTDMMMMTDMDGNRIRAVNFLAWAKWETNITDYRGSMFDVRLREVVRENRELWSEHTAKGADDWQKYKGGLKHERTAG